MGNGSISVFIYTLMIFFLRRRAGQCGVFSFKTVIQITKNTIPGPISIPLQMVADTTTACRQAGDCVKFATSRSDRV
jgi:hypothetical protein